MDAHRARASGGPANAAIESRFDMATGPWVHHKCFHRRNEFLDPFRRIVGGLSAHRKLSGF